MELCKYCRDNIESVDGVWVDTSKEATCSEREENEPHEVAPEEIECGSCGETIPFDNNTDDTCERCIAEWEQERRDQEWDYWHA